MILPNNLDKLILLCIKELYMNCINPLDLSSMTFLEVIDALSSVRNNDVYFIRQSDYDYIYKKYIESDDMNLLQRDIFYINITRFSPNKVSDDFIPPTSN